MMRLATSLTPHPWQDAAALAELYSCQTQEQLDDLLAAGLERLLPDVGMAMCIAVDASDSRRVAFAIGESPLTTGDIARAGAWSVPTNRRFAVACRGHLLGELLLGSDPEPEAQAILGDVLVHYATALVNLTLNQEARQSTENYCGSLQALEEGIVLFQEEDPEAMTARILALAGSMARAKAGALYVLREVGDVGSGLRLEQYLGMPEALLQSFRGKNDVVWPDVLLEQPAHVAELESDGSIAGLAADSVPSVLTTIAAVPLSYHGVVAGVCLLFNPMLGGTELRDHLGRLQSFGQLAAALLHRLRLEQQMAISRSIARELELAATIQRRSLPTTAPPSDRYEFAWSLVAAQHIGGDYLDFLVAPNGDIHVVVADASGHGINSALLMSSFRSNYRITTTHMPPPLLAKSLNREVVSEVGPTGMFITAALARLSTDGSATLCSAGHCPTLVYRAATGAVEAWVSDGPPLGFVDGVEYEVVERKLHPGDILALYTDGVTEATNSDLDMFGEERLANHLRQLASCSAGCILAGVQLSLAEFTGRARYDDDVSLLIVKVNDGRGGGRDRCGGGDAALDREGGGNGHPRPLTGRAPALRARPRHCDRRGPGQ